MWGKKYVKNVKKCIRRLIMTDRMQNFIRTDIACECIDTTKNPPDGIEYKEEKIGEIVRTYMKIISEKEAERIGKPCGEYITLDCGDISQLGGAESLALSSLLAKELLTAAKRLSGKDSAKELCVLVSGLGNEHMTPDALGPRTVSALTVTGHISKLDPKLFSELGCARLYAVATGVMGDTGIESAELIRGAAQSVKPDVIIAVDALASRDLSRLCTTVQMSDSGINPGSGVKNSRKEISKRTLGVPVIALGVPTVVDSVTLAANLLSEAGFDPEMTAKGKKTMNTCFVSPRNIDAVIESAASVIAASIDRAFGINQG